MIDGQTHAHTHTHTQATTIPEGQNWPRVTKAINNSHIYIYINISCKCDTNRAGHLTLDAYASRPVACFLSCVMPLQTLARKLSGPRLNIKTVLSTYGDFHVKDKTAVRTTYL